ncbi:SpoIIE family protein phosphatase [Streptomyces sp. NPDC060035]|uniref:SpoIIE family protein phosphatase n=1 Tax=Streptomyces sp. NPDC060035 TaxID=3347044 RepID=UPI003698733B
MTWTNAGHPPPILISPDGGVERLTGHGLLIHPAIALRPRADHCRMLEPGTLLQIYTDGLVEQPGVDFEVATRETADLLRLLREGACVSAGAIGIVGPMEDGWLVPLRAAAPVP